MWGLEMKRVLAVDDSATVRKVLNMTLSRAGYEVVEAVDGDETCRLGLLCAMERIQLTEL